MALAKNIPNILQLFLDNLNVEKGLSENSISSYLTDMLDCQTFLSKRKPARNLQNANGDDLLTYIKQLQSRGFSAKTQSRRISALKQFYLFCYSEKLITNNPAMELKNPKIGKTLPKFLSVDEIDKLLKYAKAQKSRLFYVMLEVLYSSGLRVSELVGLKLSNIVYDGDFLQVLGKGNKERIIPLTEIAQRELKDWIKVRVEHIKLNDKNKLFLFPSSKGSSGHITREGFAQILKSYAVACNIDYNKISPHTIRHSFATHILNNGGDLKAIQNMLGHSDIATTEIYTHVLEGKLKDAVFNNHPLSNKNYRNKKS
jgi:integrase/recombinase XerD